jgi:predicted lipoprotein with Yx(FWY)xxD motif
MALSNIPFISRPALLGWISAALLIMTNGNVRASDPHPAEVSTIQFGHGTRLTDALGMTLYTFDNDLREPGTSTCVDDCAVSHPPLIVDETPEKTPANWTPIERDDGRKQWAYHGLPVYRFIKDSHTGAAYGEGGGWNIAFDVISTPAEISVANTILGHVLASATGQTLYTHGPSYKSDDFTCLNECLDNWNPVTAPWAANNSGAFSVHARGDGIYQWSYEDKTLFLYAGDSTRGDTNGEGVDGVWRAVVLEPPPPAPSWTKVVGSDGGALYADPDGMTLYSLFEDRNSTEQTRQGGNQCDEVCLSKYWTPVTAKSKSPPIGHWSVIESTDQTLQWAYMGRPLYTLDLETRPGQLYYTTFRQFQWMKPIMYKLPALQGVF